MCVLLRFIISEVIPPYMIRYILFLAFLTISFTEVYAQSNVGLFRYFSFDNCDGTDDIGSGVNGILLNNPGCDCGVSGNALAFDGLDDVMIIPGTNSVLNTVDFTISFYYKSSAGGIQDLMSRKEFCDNMNAFSIRVSPASNSIITQVQENNGKGILFNEQLDVTNCWHHVVFVRRNDFHSLFLDGVLVREQSTVSRVDISNENVELAIAGGPCLGIQDLGYNGLIDELRIYSRALNDNEIMDLAVPIDEIITQDTLIFLGNTVDITSSNSCANSFTWSPDQGVNDITNPEASITPDQTTVYSLFYNQGECVSSDSIRISVIDPEELDCEQLFMANGFTPNNDNTNDTYGISNPFALEEFVSIEILDRWGGRVFYSSDKFAQWDGTFQGNTLNPGVYLYRVFYRCSGVDQVRTGSVTLVK